MLICTICLSNWDSNQSKQAFSEQAIEGVALTAKVSKNHLGLVFGRTCLIRPHPQPEFVPGDVDRSRSPWSSFTNSPRTIAR